MTQRSIREAAAALGVHPARITHWIATGKIQAEWVDGPRGRVRRIEDNALAKLRLEECVTGPAPTAAPSDSSLSDGRESDPDSLARARAVESYTAGLAATAIAPAVSRLVETIERLIRENGDLREEIGALKARLEAAPDGIDPRAGAESDSDPGGKTSGLAADEWESLRERLDRLSEPAPAAGPTATYPREEQKAPSAGASTRNLRRRRPWKPWSRVTSWLRELGS